MTKRVLFHSPQMTGLAREIARRHEAEIALGDIDFKRFPDGSPNTKVVGAKELATKDVSFLACFDDWGSYFEQLSVHYHLAGLAPKSYRLILPFMKTSTMERAASEDQVITAETMLRALGAIGPAGPGPVHVYTYDIHALAIRSFAGPNIVLKLKTGLKLLFEKLEQEPDLDKLTIVFPDDGAKKRFGEMDALLEAQRRLKFKVAVCGKSRIGDDDRKVVLQEGDVRGRRVVIIDDLVRTANTLFACAKVMRESGALAVDTYGTHVVHEDGGWRKFDGGVIRKLYMTDSCPAAAAAVRDNPNVEVFCLADSIANAIRE
ncbi:MAG TPA: phosphoribosyltransferase family protein [Candidatus Baltobacteraceae bacterium]|nr:phosphoribosyltransferase family protein [Candidatus Baltobacteraceae bacterium]